MLPIGDEEGAFHRQPYVTWALVAVATLVYLVQLRLAPAAGDQLVHAFGLVPARLVGDPGQAWPTLLTHVFLHGSLLHLGGNMVFLIAFGRRIESEMGSPAFLAFFLAGGVVAGLASVASRWDSSVPGIGASGAISAVMAAYLVLFPAAKLRLLVLHPLTLLWLLVGQSLLTVGVPALVGILAWFGLQLAEGLASLGSPDGVDYAAHVGGFLAGFAAVQALRWAFGLWPDEGDADGASEPPLPLKRACVGAARPLLAGQVLVEADLQLQARRPEGLDADAVPAEKLSALVGRRLLTPHFRYDPIRWSDLDEAPPAG